MKPQSLGSSADALKGRRTQGKGAEAGGHRGSAARGGPPGVAARVVGVPRGPMARVQPRHADTDLVQVALARQQRPRGRQALDAGRAARDWPVPVHLRGAQE